jgi:hypothetical protein
MALCVECSKVTGSPAKFGWTPVIREDTIDWYCSACQAKNTIAALSSDDEEERQRGYKQLLQHAEKGAVFFAGTNYRDSEPQSVKLQVTFDNDVAEDVLWERDIDKLRAQAQHYSNGNVAEFVLFIFNTFVDRYEVDHDD